MMDTDQVLMHAEEEALARHEPMETTVVNIDEDNEALIMHNQDQIVLIEGPDEEPERITGSTTDDRGSDIAAYLNLTAEFDPDTVINIVGSKLFDNFSLFDLMLHKAKLNSELGGMDSIMNDVEVLLGELKLLIQGCMKPVKGKRGKSVAGKDKKKNQTEDGSIVLDNVLATALCLDSGIWKKVDGEEMDYYTPIVNVESLFPPGPGVSVISSPKKTKVNNEVTTKTRQSRRTRKAKDDDKTVIKKEKEDEKEDGDEKEKENESEKEETAKKEDDLKNKSTPKQSRAARRSSKSTSESSNKVKKEGDEDDDGEENFVCGKCGQTLCKAYGKQHESKCKGMFVRHPEYKKVGEEFFCTVESCNIGYSFPSLYGLRKHFHESHIREEEKYFSCEYCDEKFSFKTNRNKHVHAKHIKRFVCDVCGRGFGGKDKLTSHRFTHTGEKPFECDKCEYRTAKKFNLEMHKQSKHNEFDQKNFLCAICNKQFVSMGRVRRHMEMMHSENGEGTRRRKRRGPVPPAVPVVEGEEVTTHIIETTEEDQEEAQMIQVEQEDGTTSIQYLENPIEGHPHETIITVTPIYN